MQHPAYKLLLRTKDDHQLPIFRPLPVGPSRAKASDTTACATLFSKKGFSFSIRTLKCTLPRDITITYRRATACAQLTREHIVSSEPPGLTHFTNKTAMDVH